MRKLNIGISTEQFIDWGGGIDFIRLILNGLNSVNETEKYDLKLTVFVPYHSEFKINVKNFVKGILNYFFGNKFKLQTDNIKKKSILETFKSINKSIKVVYYNHKIEGLTKKVKDNKIDFLLPLFNPLPDNFPVEWAGYIYDFQHKYYPEFFTPEEIAIRDSNFSEIMQHAKKVIVNAEAVKNDIEKFITIKKAEVITLPFCPVLNFDFFNETDISNYNLPSNFFLISNQFWKHKDHITAFRAFKLFLSKSGNNGIGLVCTGQTIDYRFPNYFNELNELLDELKIRDNVFILGYISKKDQLQILKKSISIIQPTLFEGGPGGGAVYESVAYGIPSIVSNIPVNKELSDESVCFFNVGSADDLCSKMEYVFKKKRVLYTIEELINKNEQKKLEIGKQIIRTIIE